MPRSRDTVYAARAARTPPPSGSPTLSDSEAARRPLLSPLRAALCFFVALFVVLALIVAALRFVLGDTSAPSLGVAVFFVGFDVAIGVVLMFSVALRLSRDRAALPKTFPNPIPDKDPSLTAAVSVLVAAYDEADCIVETVRALAAQHDATLSLEIIVGDDGSSDATFPVLAAAFALQCDADHLWRGHVPIASRLNPNSSPNTSVPITVARLPHSGKGATLNAIAPLARHAILVTIDADTTPASRALANLASAFSDSEVDCAAGVVTIRNGPDNWLTHHQSAEYLKNALVRIGWSTLGALEQVPGAFAAIRAEAFFAAGGFPTDSLTEDYELTFRLIDQGVRSGRVPLVVTVPSAQVFTEGPRSVAGFIRQRTRWFAGFLSTLVRFRRLIFSPRAAAFGLVRLPLKLIDALLPLTAFFSLIVLVRGALFVTGPAHVPLSRAALALFALRWLWDLLVFALATLASRSLGDPAATAGASPKPWVAWLCTATEALTYVWLKHAATLRGYYWAIGRVRTWESSRAAASRPLYRPMDELDQQPETTL